MIKSNKLKTAGYILLALVSYILFFELTFPYEKLCDRISIRLKEATGLDIKIKGLNHALPLGLAAREIFIPFSIADREEVLNLNSFTVRPLYIPLLTAGWGVKIKADVFKGEIEGSYRRRKDNETVFFDLEELNLSELDFLSTLNVVMEGMASLNGEMEMTHLNIVDAKGKADILLNDLEVKGMNIGGFEIPGIDLGRFSGELKLDKGKVTAKNLLLSGGDVDAILSGHLLIKKRILSSILRMEAKYKPTGTLKEGVDVLLSSYHKRKDKSGYYTLLLQGPLSNIKVKPL